MIELVEFIILMVILIGGGVFVDHLDPYGERADAKRRNQATRR